MSMPVACRRWGAKAQTTMPPPHAMSSSVSAGPGWAASMIFCRAASLAIGAAVENGVACRVNWSRIRLRCAASLIWFFLLDPVGSTVAGLHSQCASFEMRAAPAPQDEERFRMAQKKLPYPERERSEQSPFETPLGGGSSGDAARRSSATDLRQSDL